MSARALNVLATLLAVAAIGLMGWHVTRGSVISSEHQRERCKKFRREFFERCLVAEPRYRCEVQWAQLGGRVFDSEPSAPWSDQIDCSKEFE